MSLSQAAIELPYIFLQAVSYGIIVYAMIGFEWTVAKFFWYLFFMYFTLLYFTFYGMMTVAVTPNHHIASIISSAFYAIWNLFSGFIIPRPVKYFPLLMCRFSCVQRYLTITNSFSFFLFLSFIYLEINRGFLYGGDGTTGHVQ